MIEEKTSIRPRYLTELSYMINKVVSNIPNPMTQYYGQTESIHEKSREYEVEFSSSSKSYCIGFVDMVNSSKISSSLRDDQWSKYYGIFLNSLSKILKPHGGEVIKNVGDSLLYYFPTGTNTDTISSCIEAGLVLIEARDIINEALKRENLPPTCYRVSSDYGRVAVMRSNKSSSVDLIGPPVNLCVKINRKANKNQMVIGGDLFQIINNKKNYEFELVDEYSLGFRLAYPVYSVKRTTSKKSC